MNLHVCQKWPKNLLKFLTRLNKLLHRKDEQLRLLKKIFLVMFELMIISQTLIVSIILVLANFPIPFKNH